MDPRVRPNIILSLFVIAVVLVQVCGICKSEELDCRLMHHDPPQVPQVKQALWNNNHNNYKIMSLILEKALSKLLLCRNLRKSVGNPPLTIFAPQDDAIRFDDNRTSLYHQFVTSELEEKDFGLYLGLEVKTCFNRYVIIGPSSVNNVSVTDWNLYNNGKGIIVHGVKDFFKLEPHSSFDPDYGHACNQ